MLQIQQLDLNFLYTPKLKKYYGNGSINYKLNRIGSQGLNSIKTQSTAEYKNFSQRMFFKRRLSMKSKPLLIISYDGILGFTRDKRFHLRPQINDFIQSIKSHYQVVIVK